MLKKRHIVAIFILIMMYCMVLSGKVFSATQKQGIENFPDSYKPYLLELQKQHPKWKFIALYTNLDWKYVIDNENKFGKNLVPKSYSKEWKNTTKGQYNVEVDAGWVDSSRKAVEYTMDPRNFLNEVRIFQFESLSYDSNVNYYNGVEKILYGTEFYNKIVQYVDSSGKTITTTSKYSDLIVSAGKTSQVSSYHLASRIRQEMGAFLSNSSISGTVKGYEGLYNFYNIGATSSTQPLGAIKNGLQYAKDGKGASQSIKDKYLIPWNTKDKAITGGAIFIGSSYIHLGQDTVYLQKFHVVNKSSNSSLFWHQYMTNVLAPYSESRTIYNAYSNNDLISENITFIIPVYENMLEEPVSSPNILESDFDKDNTRVFANVQSVLNIRTGPSTSYETITSVDKNVVMTRIAKGKQSGELWDKVKLPNGIIGYAFHNYLKEAPNVQIEKINVNIDNTTINKGQTKTLQVTILPEEAKNNGITFSSSNTNIARVDDNGNIIGIRSGKTTITIKAKENNVSAQIEIEVYSPVTDMNLNVNNLTLQVGQQFQISPVLFPEDATNTSVKFSSENEEIVEIDSNGKVTAITEGNSTIIAITTDGNIEKRVDITIIKKIDENELSFDSSLKVLGNEITGWKENEMKVSSIKEKINTKYNIKIYNAKGELLEDNKLAGTGSKIQILDGENIVIEYYIILYGDVNGDGKINSIDLYVLQRHILEIEKFTGVFLKAGNIRKNGNNPSSLDSLLIQRHILEIQFIEQ